MGSDSLFDRMKRNPQGDWRIEDVETLCRQHGLVYMRPRKSSHAKVKHPKWPPILTVPFNRPIKAVYIRQLIRLIEHVEKTK